LISKTEKESDLFEKDSMIGDSNTGGRKRPAAQEVDPCFSTPPGA
jgi:hypothetical protein